MKQQFGFKKGVGCTHAIYSTVHKIVESMTKDGNTVNLCTIDLSKAFDKVNHHALLLKLMKRNLFITLLGLLEYWLNNCFSCIKWNCIYSDMLAVRFGVRQGSVLSPIFSAVYLNDIFTDHYLTRNSFVVLYVDDIITGDFLHYGIATPI